MYSYHETGGVPLKLWDQAGPFEEAAMAQLRNVAALPFVHSHVAGMPDVHWGLGATVGSVIATKGAIVPAAVGVDIGCGMMAVRTSLIADDLPDDLKLVRIAIEAAVPHGRTDNGGPNDKGTWQDAPADNAALFAGELRQGYEQIVARHPKVAHRAVDRHLGTLGTGNHFIEICLDEEQRVWAMLHSGSRGIGNAIGSYFIEKAKREMERWFIGQHLPDENLAYLVEHSELFDDYWFAVGWAQAYAAANRRLMMQAVLRALALAVRPFTTDEQAINCHHNYVAREKHFGANVMVTRKGAVRAREGDLGIIPGSMGTPSFIVEGRGNADSFCSCSHGAGRRMSRNAARKRISHDEHVMAMRGIEARTDEGVIDESPSAYKDVHAVMMAQEDLVRVRHTLRQVVNVKG